MCFFKSPQSSRRAGFTLTEVLIASVISTLVLGAVVSLTIAATRLYYVESDYVEIGNQSRRLIDRLIEEGTQADDLSVFRDINEIVPVTPGDRGDCLVVFNRATDGTGGITTFTCYYLARTQPITATSGISLWRFEGTAPGGRTPFPAIALNNYTRTVSQRVSGDIFNGPFPRVMPATTVPITPREGVFTNDGFRSSGSLPTVLVNLPSRLSARAGAGTKPTSNLTFAITPRR
jgi:prepilin-type N-terminal cleavage/methylation domain-containing protein